MEIPYTISTRPDTGLWNAKVGIWLFLASEIMLFGGLFSAYIFLRLDAHPGEWPHGLLNVPVGTMNTAILIMSSVTVVLAWAALKMRRYRAYWWYMLATILCGVIFLTVNSFTNGRRSLSTSALTLNRKRSKNMNRISATSTRPTEVCHRVSRSADICTITRR